MNIFEIIQELKSKDVVPEATEAGQLKLIGQVDNLSDEFIGLIKLNKNDLIRFLKDSTNGSTPISKTEPEESYPLSNAQFRIWLLSRSQRGCIAYNIVKGFHVQGNIDKNLLEESFRIAIERHESLRTVFKQIGDEPRQFVLADPPFAIQFNDLSRLPSKKEEILKEIDLLYNHYFDLSKGPLIKVGLSKIEDDQAVILLCVHHIICDGSSLNILINEVNGAYESLISSKSVYVEPLDIQYRDYSAWFTKEIDNSKERYAKLFRESYLSEGYETIDLPYDYSRQQRKTFNGALSKFYFGENKYDNVVAFCKRNNLSVFNLLSAILVLLIYRLSGQKKIIIGTPVSGRTHLEIEDQIGLFVNTIPISTEVNEEQSFLSFLKNISSATKKGIEFQDFPFEEMIRSLDSHGDASRNPLFDVMVVLQKTNWVNFNNPQNSLTWSSLEKYLFPKGKIEFENLTAKLDLTFFFSNDPDGDFFLEIEYSADLFHKDTISKYYNIYLTILSQVIDFPEKPVNSLEILTPAERNTLLFHFNDTATDYPRDKTIVDLFYEQAAKTPDGIAVVFEDQQLTYRQLDERSNQLGHLLRSRGVREDNRVTICMERSLEMIIGILAILKAGAAYVPIDSAYPRDRIDYMIEDTAAPIAITAGNVQLPPTDHLSVIHLDTDKALIDAQHTTTVTTNLLPDHLAYVIYTSGSTGRPKGAGVFHKGILNLMLWYIKEFSITANDRNMIISSIGFDLTQKNIFGTLLAGGSIVFAGKGHYDSRKTVNRIVKDRVTIINCAPNAFYPLAEEEDLCREPNSLRLVVLGGEPIHLDRMTSWISGNGQNCEVVNSYGPTECTDIAAFYRMRHPADHVGKNIPIGRPNDNVHLFVLNQWSQLQPIGIPGEICIAGEGVGAGYLNDAGLTHSKFKPNPFGKGKIYHSGDLGRWTPDGNIEYLGRHDNQVKIRGYRIELAEIERVLQNSGLVRQVAVEAIDNNTGNGTLTAYVVPQDNSDKQAIVSYLRERLPAYMVPSVWVKMHRLPLSPNGKIDRKSLPKPELSTLLNDLYMAPQTQLEKQLAAIWEKLLGTGPIGINSSFFDLGGHSLLAMRLETAIRTELRVEVSIATIFHRPTIAALASFIAAIPDATPVLPAILPRPRPSKIPLSFAQERLWFIDALGGSLPYHISFTLRLSGELHSRLLEKALVTIVNRHEVLRTVIVEEDGQPYQHILDKDGWKLGNGENLITQAPFNLSADYLLRADLVQTAPTEHVLVGTMHHIVADGWSIPILVKELTELYNAFLTDRPYQLPDLPVQYADYAIWQREHLTGDVLQNKLAYWRQQLSEAPVLQLPTDHPRKPARNSNGASTGFQLDKQLSTRLEALGQENGATLYMTLLSVFNILLFKYSRQEDICIGSPIAGRQVNEVEDLIGFFVNTLVLRSRISPGMSFRDLLLQVRDTTLQAYAHQDVPFEKVVEALVTERDLSRNPLFDVLFVLQNNVQAHSIEQALSGLSVSIEENPGNKAMFDLLVTLQENAGGISGTVTYNSDLYDHGTIQRMITHYKQLLQAVVTNPDQQAGKLPMITETERHELLFGFNDTKTDYPGDTTIADLFYTQAATTPDSIAVVFENEQLTYRQLDERSNQLGHLLQSKGVREDCLVVIGMERSPEMIIAILAILKAGGAYVPVDPAYPRDRINYMLQDTAAPIAITAGNVQLPPTDHLSVIHLDTDKALIDAQHTTTVTTNLLPNHLAYIIYTSGSTGRPNGISMPDKALVNLLLWHAALLGTGRNRPVLQFASVKFDAGFQEIFSALCFGGSIHLIDEQKRKDAGELLRVIAQQGIAHLFIPYVVLKNLCEYARETGQYPLGLETIFCTGEQLRLSPDVQELMSRTGCRLWNYYGPSETHVVTAYAVEDQDYRVRPLPPIGKPIANTQIYILGPDHDLVPIGVPGEIGIGGAGLAYGYLNRPDLTAEKFIPHPFSTEENARIYRTGDLGRWLPDGNIEFLGRIDDQLKIRGYRIEPGEIETVLLQSGLVQQAVVLGKEDTPGNKRLIAWLVPAAGYERESAMAALRTQLPEYMIPSLLVELDALPLTPNGKTDRKALIQIGLSAATQPEYEAPEGPLETQLATIWLHLLGADRIGRHDNFFQLGGHSLLAIRMSAAIRTELGIEIDIAALFHHPTIAALACFIATTQNALPVLPAIPTGPRPAKIPLSFSQERLWFIDALEGSLPFHLPFVLRLKGKLDSRLLEKALVTIVNRHEVLRTVIAEEDGQPYQHILDKDGWKLGTADEGTLATTIQQLIQAPFNLASDYLLRADLVQIAPTEHVLVGTMHHIVSDGWSTPILVKELTELYNAFLEARPYQLPELPVQYADYAIWQRNYLTTDILQTKLAYWQQQLAEVPVLQLPTDHPRGPIRSSNGATTRFLLDNQLAGRLEALSLESGATLYMTLLSAFNILLFKYSGQEDICIGSPIAGRQTQEVEGLIGFFINTLVLRSRVSPEMSFRDLLIQVKTSTLEAYAHQDLPFEKIVDAVVTERDMSRSPLFDVKFALHNLPETGKLDLGPDLELIAENSTQTFAQIDISLDMYSSPGGINGSVTYNTDLYDPATIQRMITHYQRLLQAVVTGQDQPIGSLEMITEAERHDLLFTFNDTKTDFPLDKTIVDLFYAQAAKTPDSVALVFQDQQLTYRQLDERSNQLGHLLRSKGVREDSLVVIGMERSLEMIIAILGVLKAGGAYVPVDPEYPRDRIDYMLEDTAAKIALTAGSVYLPETEDRVVIHLNDEESLIEAQDTAPVKTKLRPTHLAYVIYTSGSSGQPKGVMIEHKSFVNLVLSQISLFHLDEEKIVLQFASFSFDASCSEIFTTLISGARLVIPTKQTLLSADLITELIEKYKIDTLTIPPSYQLQIKDSLHTIKTIISAGEELNREATKEFQLAGVNVFNAYGPTENTVCATFAANPIQNDRISIGRPIANVQIYILGPDQHLVPIGVTGEICLAGAGLARGYLNRSDLTAEKFIPHPFSTNPDARIYRTGDLGRWLPDGNIEFLGRLDQQVKIRGYRIEPGEIESALLQTGQVQQAVVLCKEDTPGNKRLIAWLVPSAGYERETTLAALRARLPEYMVPSLLVELDTLPLTPNGKTDRKALLQMDLSGVAQSAYEAPQGPIETQLASIWANLLGVDRIGRHDNFFQLGGDSIITIQVVSRLRHAGYHSRPQDIFIHQTIAALATAIAAQDNSGITAEQGILTGKSGLLPIQQWYLTHQQEHLSHYNQGVLLAIDKAIPVEVLQQAVPLLAERHDALRFRYEQQTSGWEQHYSSNPVLPLIVEQGTSQITDIANIHQAGLDIHKGQLLRVVLINTLDHDTHNRLLIIIHHLVVDGVSWRILLQDLEDILSALTQGDTPQWSPKTSSYRQWYNALADYGKSSRLLTQRNYWLTATQQYRPLPYDHAWSGPIQFKNIGHLTSRLSPAATQALLQDAPAAYHTEINDILLAALAKTIMEWTGSTQAVIGLEGHGREEIIDHIDLTHTVGWFTTLYPLALSRGAASGPADWIRTVKEQLRKVPDKGLGYGVLKYIDNEPTLQGDSPWDIVFNYLGQLDNVLNRHQNLTPAGEHIGERVSPEGITADKLSVNSMVMGGELVLNWGYSTLHFHPERIQQLAAAYLDHLQSFITHCTQQRKKGAVLTPSDYGLGNEIAYDELDSFLQENENTETDTIIDL